MKLTTWFSLIGAMVLLVSCRWAGFYIQHAENPVEGLRSVAIVPVLVSAPLDPEDDSIEIGDAIAGEIIQSPGIEKVIRPLAVTRALRDNELTLKSEEEVRILARALDVDAVLVASITEYDPFHPPRVGFAAQLFLTNYARMDSRKIIQLTRSSTAQPISQFVDSNVVQVERVYDASHRETYDRAKQFGRGHRDREEALEGGDRILWIPKLYLRFISHALVTDLFNEFINRSREFEKANAVATARP